MLLHAGTDPDERRPITDPKTRLSMRHAARTMQKYAIGNTCKMHSEGCRLHCYSYSVTTYLVLKGNVPFSFTSLLSFMNGWMGKLR